MALYIYRNFIKKQPNDAPASPIQNCAHQRITSDNSAIELTTGCAHSRESSNINGNITDSSIDASKQNEGFKGAIDSTIRSPSCSICNLDEKNMSRYRWKLMIGLFFPFLVQTLDSTIIAGALTFIADDFNQLSQLNWIVSAFTLTAATFIPFWGHDCWGSGLWKELLGPAPITRTDGRTDIEVSQTFVARLNTIDFGGQLLFLFGMGMFVLAITWGGAYYPWSDVKVFVPLTIGGILILAFLVWEYLMLPGKILSSRFPTKKAMINFSLLGRRNVGLLMYINLCTGMAMYAVYYFIELYFVLILSYTSSKAGTNLIYFMPGLGFGAFLANFLINRTPRQTFYPLFLGTLIEPLGICLLAFAIHKGNLHLIFGMLALTGIGTGLRFMPGTLHAVAYFPDQIASVVPLMSLSVSLGGTLATTIMLNIFQNELRKDGLSFSSVSGLSGLASMGIGQGDDFRESAKRGLETAFGLSRRLCGWG